MVSCFSDTLTTVWFNNIKVKKKNGRKSISVQSDLSRLTSAIWHPPLDLVSVEGSAYSFANLIVQQSVFLSGRYCNHKYNLENR